MKQTLKTTALLATAIVMIVMGHLACLAADTPAVTLPDAKMRVVKEFTESEIENAFVTYIADKIPTARGEFETQEAYQQRLLSKAIGADKIYAFPICGGIEHAYDMDGQRLTVFVGGLRCIWIDKARGRDNTAIGDGAQIEVSEVRHKLAPFEGQNAYGAKCIVTPTDVEDFVLSIDNCDVIPASIFNRDVLIASFNVYMHSDSYIHERTNEMTIGGCSLFHFSLPMATAQAQALAAQGIEVMFYVHPHSHQESVSRVSGGVKPTLDDPREFIATDNIITVTLVSIVVRNAKNKEVLVQYNFPADKNQPPYIADPPAPEQSKLPQPWDK